MTMSFIVDDGRYDLGDPAQVAALVDGVLLAGVTGVT